MRRNDFYVVLILNHHCVIAKKNENYAILCYITIFYKHYTINMTDLICPVVFANDTIDTVTSTIPFVAYNHKTDVASESWINVNSMMYLLLYFCFGSFSFVISVGINLYLQSQSTKYITIVSSINQWANNIIALLFMPIYVPYRGVR